MKRIKPNTIIFITILILISFFILYILRFKDSHIFSKKDEIYKQEVTQIVDIIEQNPSNNNWLPSYHFYYDQLDTNERKLYLSIAQANYNLSNMVKISNQLTSQSIFKTILAVKYDLVDIFWVKSIKLLNMPNNNLSLIFEYDMSLYDLKNEFDSNINNILKQIPSSNSEYEQLQFIYEYIVKNINYDPSCPYDQNIISAAIYKKAICVGYAKLFQLLCLKYGINCSIVSGYVSNDDNLESHIWNMVQLNNNYYWIDPSWGDSFDNINTEYINYSYFMINDEQLMNTHLISDKDIYTTHKEDEDYFIYPSCTDFSMNYYVYNKCYFYPYNYQDLINYIYLNLSQNNKSFLTLKFNNYFDYQDAYTKLLINKELENILLKALGNCSSCISYKCEYSDTALLIFILIKQ